MGVHASNGELFALTTGAIRVFNIGDNGNVAPKRSIAGAQTGFAFPVAVWTVGDELFVADGPTAALFADAALLETHGLEKPA